ncbi:MAG: hypothetical protein DRI36_00825 [Caldiserica bacterium]|nr:MAG: hypothetical protein DRI36_00825 [Caldisericota bacterium]
MNGKNKKMNEVERIKIEFANLGGMLASRLSLSPIVGQIYALLYLSKEPVSLNEMVEKLGISKASASINIRYLESWGAVKKVWVGKGRKDYYMANSNVLEIFMNRFIKRFSDILEEVNKFERKVLSGGDRFIKERWNELRTLYMFVIDKLFEVREYDKKKE